MNDVILEFKSRRNRALLVRTASGTAVRKHFAAEEGFRRELSVYRRLARTDLPCAEVLEVGQQFLTLTRIPGPTLLEVLEQQEASAVVDYAVWDSLAQWLAAFVSATDWVMTDVNLRNFLWDPERQKLYGIDFEECAPGSLADTAASAAAFVRLYKPENTPVKKQISEHLIHCFSRLLNIDPQTLFRLSKQKEILLLQRRKSKAT